MAMYRDGSRWRYVGVARAKKLEHEASDRRYFKWWSTQPDPAQRRRMHIKKSTKGNLHFAYEGESDSAGGGSGGESLHHFIYKTAIASLSAMTFKVNNLPGKPVIPLRVVKAETEKRFEHKGQAFYADIFIDFSISPEFELRWGGKLAVEIIHTSKTPQVKREFYEDQGVAVLEVKVSERVLWRLKKMDLSNYGDDDERRLVEDVVARFSKEPIFTYALVDSPTRSWLFYENWAHEIYVSRLRQVVSRQQSALEELRTQMALSVEKQKGLVDHHELRAEAGAREATRLKGLLQSREDDLTAAQSELLALKRSRRIWVKSCLALLSILFVLAAILLGPLGYEYLRGDEEQRFYTSTVDNKLSWPAHLRT